MKVLFKEGILFQLSLIDAHFIPWKPLNACTAFTCVKNIGWNDHKFTPLLKLMSPVKPRPTNILLYEYIHGHVSPATLDSIFYPMVVWRLQIIAFYCLFFLVFVLANHYWYEEFY